MHPRGNRLVRLGVDHLDPQLAVAVRRGHDAAAESRSSSTRRTAIASRDALITVDAWSVDETTMSMELVGLVELDPLYDQL